MIKCPICQHNIREGKNWKCRTCGYDIRGDFVNHRTVCKVPVAEHQNIKLKKKEYLIKEEKKEFEKKQKQEDSGIRWLKILRKELRRK